MQILTQSSQTLNTETILHEIEWFKRVLEFQMMPYLGATPKYHSLEQIASPDLHQFNSPYSRLILKENLSTRERLVVTLALMPIIEPQSLDVFFALNPLTNRNFAEFGGKADPSYGSFVPTLETAIFLLGGRDWAKRQKAVELFSPTANFPLQKMIEMQRSAEGESIFRSVLSLKKQFYSQLIEGKPYYPKIQ